MAKRKLLYQGQDMRFDLPKITSECNRIIFAGLFPPAQSESDDQHNNRTSLEVAKLLGHQFFDWIDIWPFTPSENKDVDESTLEQHLRRNLQHAEAWFTQIVRRAQELHLQGHVPIVYICGQICIQNWEQVTKNFVRSQIDPLLDEVYTITSLSCPVLVVLGLHPSAAVMSHGAPKTQAKFEFFMRLLNALRQSELSSPETITKLLGDKEATRRKAATHWCRHLFGTNVWPPRYSHLRHSQFVDIEQDSLRLLCQQFTHSQCLLFLQSPTFCSRIGNAQFIQCCINTTEKLGAETASRCFQQSNFSARLENPAFLTALEQSSQTLSRSATQVLFSNQTFCKELDPADRRTKVGKTSQIINENFLLRVTNFVQQGPHHLLFFWRNAAFVHRFASEPKFVGMIQTDLLRYSKALVLKLYNCPTYVQSIGSENFESCLRDLSRLYGSVYTDLLQYDGFLKGILLSGAGYWNTAWQEWTKKISDVGWRCSVFGNFCNCDSDEMRSVFCEMFDALTQTIDKDSICALFSCAILRKHLYDPSWQQDVLQKREFLNLSLLSCDAFVERCMTDTFWLWFLSLRGLSSLFEHLFTLPFFCESFFCEKPWDLRDFTEEFSVMALHFASSPGKSITELCNMLGTWFANETFAPAVFCFTLEMTQKLLSCSSLTSVLDTLE